MEVLFFIEVCKYLFQRITVGDELDLTFDGQARFVGFWSGRIRENLHSIITVSDQVDLSFDGLVGFRRFWKGRIVDLMI